jgi:lantibiotic modifying enzyme
MTYDPIHLASNLPVLSVQGLCIGTKLPTLKSYNLTFRSFHALVSSWYFCKFATTLSLSNLSKSFSSASHGHAGVAVAVLKLQCFTSSRRTASAPYINRNNMKFVALHIVVLWLHTACGMTSTHFLFFSPVRIF